MIEGVSLDTYGPWGLVSMFVMLVFLGGLVPRWIHNERIKDKNQLIDKLTQALDKRDEQFDTLLKQNEISTAALEELKKASREARPAL